MIWFDFFVFLAALTPGILAWRYWNANRSLQIQVDKLTERSCQTDELLYERVYFQETLLYALRDAGLNLMVVENGQVIHVGSRELAYQLGYSDEDIDARLPLLDAIHPDDREKIEDYYQRCVAGESVPNHIEIGLLSRQGERMEIEAFLAVVPGSEPVRVVLVVRDITERKQEQLLLELLSKAIDQSSDAIFLSDSTLRFVFVNKEACRALGYTQEELLNIGPMEVDPEIINEPRLEALRGLAQGKRTLAVSNYQTKDGHRFPAEIATTQIIYREARYCISVVRDVSEQQRVQRELVRKEHEFRTLAEHLPDPVFRFDQEYRRVYVNQAAVRIVGVPLEELLGKTPADAKVVRENDTQKVMDAIRTVFSTGKNASIDVEYATRDGSLREFNMLLVPEHDESGEIATVLGLAHETTQIRHAERHAAKFFANMPGFAYTYRQSPEGHGCFPYASPAIEELYGLHPEDVATDATALDALAHPEDRPRIEAAIANSARTMTPFQIEYRICRPEYPERWLEARSHPEHQADGSILWYGIMLDITERKRMEDELRRTADFQKLLLNGLRDVGIWQLVIENGKIIYHNDIHIGSTLGYKEGDFDAIPDFIDLVHPDDRPSIIQRYQQRLSGYTGPSFYEMGVITKDGSRREFLLHTCLIPDSNPIRTLTLSIDITDRKRMESLMEQERSTLRTFINALPDMAWMKDCDGRYLACNPLFENCFGASEAEIIGKTDFDFVDAELATFFRQKDKAAEAADTPCTNEEWITFASDGRRALLETVKAAVRDPQGKIIGVIGIGHDITERKLLENELRQREQEFRALVEKSPDTISRYDRECRRIYANPALANDMPDRQKLGLKPTETFNNTPSSQAYEAAMRQAMENGKESQFTFSWHSTNDLPRWSHIRLIPEYDSHGQVVGLLTIGRDITEHRQMLAALARREYSLANAQRIAHLGSWVLDLDSKRLECSIEALSIFEIGHSPSDTSYQTLLSRIHPDDRPLANHAFHDALNNRKAYDVQHRLLFADGRLKYVHERGEITLDGHGEPARLIGTVQDITVLKESEIRLRHSRDMLRAMAALHDQEHEVERREIARKIHEDLAQNLSALRINLVALDKCAQNNPTCLNTVASMNQTLDSSIRLLRSMVSSLRPTVLDHGISSALHWLVEDFGKGVDLDLVVDIDNRAEFDDSTTTFIFRAAQEILINAALHAAASTIRISLCIIDDTCRLSIRDDGRGFDPAERSDKGAMGLLRLAEQAERRHGHLRIDSSPGKGTLVEITLPMPAKQMEVHTENQHAIH
jgi:PAS domain S-box-containing protein